MNKNGHIGPIHPYSLKYNKLYHNSFKSYYITLNTKHISKLRIIIHVLQNVYQSHMSAFFSKAASSERRLPEYSLYLKGGSHDGVNNAQ